MLAENFKTILRLDFFCVSQKQGGKTPDSVWCDKGGVVGEEQRSTGHLQRRTQEYLLQIHQQR